MDIKRIVDGVVGWLADMVSWVITCLCIFYLSYFDSWSVTLFFIVITIITGLLLAKLADRFYKFKDKE